MEQITVRLPKDAYDQLKQEADSTGIPPAVLARSWILKNIFFPQDHSDFADLPQGFPPLRDVSPGGNRPSVWDDPAVQKLAKESGIEMPD